MPITGLLLKLINTMRVKSITTSIFHFVLEWMVSLYHDSIINYIKWSYGTQNIHKIQQTLIFFNGNIRISRAYMLISNTINQAKIKIPYGIM